jgi:predicted transport protein
MSELRLFNLEGKGVHESHPKAFKLEKEIQDLFEKNLEALLGVRFVASEFVAGAGNRIDTLGIDENNFPVVIEYKLDKHKTVINQGVAYLVWIKNHQEAYWKAVFSKLGQKVADSIDFSSVRLICVAAEFTRDDLGMYELMPGMIDLVRYRRFGDSQLLLERITSATDPSTKPVKSEGEKTSGDKPIGKWLAEADASTKGLYDSLRQAILDQGEDVTEKETKLYFAFKRTRNFVTVCYGSKAELILYLHLDPDEFKEKGELPEGLRDVRTIGHWGTGNLEMRIKSQKDVEKAKPLILHAYEGGQS